jgi:hypothetical protein
VVGVAEPLRTLTVSTTDAKYRARAAKVPRPFHNQHDLSQHLTGVASVVDEVAPKRLELMHELVPKTKMIGFLMNPLRSSPPLDGASVLSASRFVPLAPFPFASPCRFSHSAQEPG